MKTYRSRSFAFGPMYLTLLVSAFLAMQTVQAFGAHVIRSRWEFLEELGGNQMTMHAVRRAVAGRKPQFLVQAPPLILPYHNGQVLAGNQISIYITWYGRFSKAQKSTIMDFLASFKPSKKILKVISSPSVSSWWKPTAAYKDVEGKAVSPSLKVSGQVVNRRTSLGKNLKTADVETLVVTSLETFPADANAIYLILTADDVEVESFCDSSCGSHSSLGVWTSGQEVILPYAWVGNSGLQCPGQCAWPFASPKPPAGPVQIPLLPPNGDVGLDGMIINIAAMLAGAATNPFDNAYYQGDASLPLEAATACEGLFGPGSYPGYPGRLLFDNAGSSFNAYGIHGRKFLLPALWNPITFNCQTLPTD
ncbi:unnamed protein product [Sphagnum troendelagicum]|uniref:Protein EXORDIUM-like 2 n=1 Tax=Sphagnum troendelagicum TaxID=128251 RepID=A0ABP0UFA8_9BRYO